MRVWRAQVSNVFSQEHSFVTGPAIGRQSTVKFLATADLGHAQTDGSAEINHELAKDDLNTTPEGTLQYVSSRSLPLPWMSCSHSVSRTCAHRSTRKHLAPCSSAFSGLVTDCQRRHLL